MFTSLGTTLKQLGQILNSFYFGNCNFNSTSKLIKSLGTLGKNKQLSEADNILQCYTTQRELKTPALIICCFKTSYLFSPCL